MIWALILILGAAALAVIAWFLPSPRKGWPIAATALLLGLAGYAAQGRPHLAGSPSAPPIAKASDPSAIIKVRQAMVGRAIPATDRWLIIGDAMARNGQYGDAAEVLLGSVEADPKNAEAWLALANALTAHAQGNITPASLYAFRQAGAAAPNHPGPPFFLGLAMAQSGRLAEARALWTDLLARSSADAPWRKELIAQLTTLDKVIAQTR